MTALGTCAHLAAITTVRQARRRVCDECVKIGAQWVHLRTCQECGGTHCCDDSPNRHATKHARATGHPVRASAEPGERWLYCYRVDPFADYLRPGGGHLAATPARRMAGPLRRAAHVDARRREA